MVEIGTPAPRFRLQTSTGEYVSLEDFHGKKNVVVYFYPKDFTKGCTAEACEFRDSYEEFKNLGAEVIGISNDDQKSHDAFAAQHKLPFILLSDLDGSVIKSCVIFLDVSCPMLLPELVGYGGDSLGVANRVGRKFDRYFPR